MNKKTLWFGILVLVILGIVVVGKTSNQRPAAVPEAANTAIGNQLDANAPAAAAPAPAKPVAKTPPKVSAKPQQGIAGATVLPEDIILDVSTDFARTHQSELGRFIKYNPDFDHYYVVAKWNCGGTCELASVIDKRTGKVYIAPTDKVGVKQIGPNFKPYSLDSNLYRVINDDIIETYSFDGQHFTLVNIEAF